MKAHLALDLFDSKAALGLKVAKIELDNTRVDGLSSGIHSVLG